MLRFFSKRLQELQEVEGNERGFTLVELLVVIIIIGVLAAIAIPTFLAQRERAWEAAAKSELRNAAAAATSCAVDNNGSYAGCDDVDTLKGFGWNDDNDVDQTFTVLNLGGGTANGWSGTSQHVSDDTIYSFTTDAADDFAGQVTCTTACP